MSVKVTKAIIPAAGLGTRMLPIARSVPKEMLPIVDRPAISYLVEEAVKSGATDILIITNREKDSIENYFDYSVEYEQKLQSGGKILHSKGQKYTLYFTCARDGDLFETLKLHRNFNDTWRAKLTVKKASEADIEDYKRGLERSNIRRKTHARKPRKRRPTQAQPE